MNDNKSIMRFESVLPEDFDGTFLFTNWSDEDFVGVWNKKEYHYPAQSTSPMIMPEQTPLEIQHIRKKFAKDLAEREFFKSQQYKTTYVSQERNNDGSPKLNSIHQAGTYNLEQLTPFIQRSLQPLPVKKAVVTPVVNVSLESKLSLNEDGVPVTTAIDQKTSLREKALKA
jgi:hypothetical protein